MADNRNEIDELFRQRFDGLRDNSVNARSQWMQFQSQLSQTAAAGASGISWWSGMTVSHMAAAVAFSAICSAALIGDNPLQVNYDAHAIAAVEKAQTRQQTPEINVEATASAETHLRSTPVLTSTLDASQTLPDAVATVQGADDLMEDAPMVVAYEAASTSPSVANNAESRPQATTYASGDWAGSNAGAGFMRGRDNIHPMAMLALAASPEPSIIEREAGPVAVIFDADAFTQHRFFFRGGVRVGSGESNSREVESRWAADEFAGFGYEFAPSKRSFFSVEVDWLRRSGMGIERTRAIDVTPIASAISNFAAASERSSLSLDVREGLIATRMTYVHIPFAFHHQTVYNRLLIAAGGYFDFMISARNEAFLIYNNQEYSASRAGINQISVMDGLNRVRYGVSLGADYEVTDRIQGTFVGMIPLNSPVSNDSEYMVIDHSNKLVDFQFGLKYRI